MTGLTTQSRTIRPLRVVVGGIGCENTTFSAHRMGLSEFTVHRGPAVAEVLPFVAPGSTDGVEWIPTIVAWGQASGPIEPEVFDSLSDELLEGIRRAGDVDGVLLDLHGAMFVRGRGNCEETLLERIREVVGTDVVISVAMDPHGNLSERLARLVDIATCYRLAPHEDKAETRLRAARNLVDVVRRGLTLVSYRVDVPMLLNGERTSTDVEPGRSTFALADAAALRPTIVDAAMWIGFAWADEARCRAAVMVTGIDENDTRSAALEMARALWARRHDFRFVSEHWGTFDEALRFAAALPSSTAGPLIISDSGDNVTAGAFGDATDTVRLLVSSGLATSGRAVLVAGIPDAATVERCQAAGIGGYTRVRLGARLETRFGDPIDAGVTVLAITTRPNGLTSVLVDLDGTHVIVSSGRTRWVDESHFTEVGVDARTYDVILVKNGYLFPFQRDIAADWFLALTPGATDLDHSRLNYDHLVRPLFPFDDHETELTAQRVSPERGRR